MLAFYTYILQYQYYIILPYNKYMLKAFKAINKKYSIIFGFYFFNKLFAF